MGINPRYSRQTQLPGFGPEAQHKLTAGKVLVVGAGGLGIPVLQYLTGMGVGTLGVVDGDVVSLNNLHRQVLYTESDVGKPKATAAIHHLAQRNSTISFIEHALHLQPDNALEIIQGYDVVVDATDNFAARYLINDACIILNKPFIYGALHQNEGQVSVFNYQNGPTYRCLFPTPPPPNQLPDCNTAGVLGVVPGLVGSYQALEAVKVLTGVGESLSGYLLLLDFMYNTQHKMKLKAKPENLQIQHLKASYAGDSCATIQTIPVKELKDWLTGDRDIQVLDVREPHEFRAGHHKQAISLPLSQFEAHLDTIAWEKTIAVICQKGGRSQKAAHLLLEKKSTAQVFSVEGGMEAWHEQFSFQGVVTESPEIDNL